MKLLCLTVLFAYSFALGTGLECFQCGLTSSLCITKATCAANESCFSRNFTAGFINIFTSGCTKNENCGKVATESYLGISYTTATQCCNVDLCNGASAVQASMLAIPILVLARFLAF